MSKRKEIERLIAKYRAEIAELEEREEDLLRRIQILENIVPTVLVWYMWKVSQANREPPLFDSEDEARQKLLHLESVLEDLQKADHELKQEESLMKKRIEELELSLKDEYEETPIEIPPVKTEIPLSEISKTEIPTIEHEIQKGDFRIKALEEKRQKYEELLQDADNEWKKMCETLIIEVDDLTEKLKSSSINIKENEQYILELEEDIARKEKELQAKIREMVKKTDALVSELSDKEREKYFEEDLDDKEKIRSIQESLGEVTRLKDELISPEKVHIQEIPTITKFPKEPETFLEELPVEPEPPIEEIGPKPSFTESEVSSIKAEIIDEGEVAPVVPPEEITAPERTQAEPIQEGLVTVQPDGSLRTPPTPDIALEEEHLSQILSPESVKTDDTMIQEVPIEETKLTLLIPLEEQIAPEVTTTEPEIVAELEGAGAIIPKESFRSDKSPVESVTQEEAPKVSAAPQELEAIAPDIQKKEFSGIDMSIEEPVQDIVARKSYVSETPIKEPSISEKSELPLDIKSLKGESVTPEVLAREPELPRMPSIQSEVIADAVPIEELPEPKVLTEISPAPDITAEEPISAITTKESVLEKSIKAQTEGMVQIEEQDLEIAEPPMVPPITSEKLEPSVSKILPEVSSVKEIIPKESIEVKLAEQETPLEEQDEPIVLTKVPEIEVSEALPLEVTPQLTSEEPKLLVPISKEEPSIKEIPEESVEAVVSQVEPSEQKSKPEPGVDQAPLDHIHLPVPFEKKEPPVSIISKEEPSLKEIPPEKSIKEPAIAFVEENVEKILSQEEPQPKVDEALLDELSSAVPSETLEHPIPKISTEEPSMREILTEEPTIVKIAPEQPTETKVLLESETRVPKDIPVQVPHVPSEKLEPSVSKIITQEPPVKETLTVEPIKAKGSEKEIKLEIPEEAIGTSPFVTLGEPEPTKAMPEEPYAKEAPKEEPEGKKVSLEQSAQQKISSLEPEAQVPEALSIEPVTLAKLEPPVPKISTKEPPKTEMSIEEKTKAKVSKDELSPEIPKAPSQFKPPVTLEPLASKISTEKTHEKVIPTEEPAVSKISLRETEISDSQYKEIPPTVTSEKLEHPVSKILPEEPIEPKVSEKEPKPRIPELPTAPEKPESLVSEISVQKPSMIVIPIEKPTETGILEAPTKLSTKEPSVKESLVSPEVRPEITEVIPIEIPPTLTSGKEEPLIPKISIEKPSVQEIPSEEPSKSKILLEPTEMSISVEKPIEVIISSEELRVSLVKPDGQNILAGEPEALHVPIHPTDTLQIQEPRVSQISIKEPYISKTPAKAPYQEVPAEGPAVSDTTTKLSMKEIPKEEPVKIKDMSKESLLPKTLPKEPTISLEVPIGPSPVHTEIPSEVLYTSPVVPGLVSESLKQEPPSEGQIIISDQHDFPSTDLKQPGFPDKRRSIESSSCKSIKNKCRVKDHLIKSMADELRELARNNIWSSNKGLTKATSADPVNTYDFDRVTLLLYLDGQVPQNFYETMKDNETYSSENPFIVKIVNKLDQDSLLIEWGPPPSPEVVGFQIFINGQFLHWVHSAKRNMALLHPLDLGRMQEITVSPVNHKGDIVYTTTVVHTPS